jgi:hypothetical protein
VFTNVINPLHEFGQWIIYLESYKWFFGNRIRSSNRSVGFDGDANFGGSRFHEPTVGITFEGGVGIFGIRNRRSHRASLSVSLSLRGKVIKNRVLAKLLLITHIFVFQGF